MSGRPARWLRAVDLARDEFLAGTAFAQDQDRRVGRGDQVDLPRHRFERRALADQFAECPGPGDLLAQVLVLQFQPFSQRIDLGKRPGGGDGRRRGRRSSAAKPMHSRSMDPRVNDGQDAQDLLAVDERLPREPADPLCPHPVRAGPPSQGGGSARSGTSMRLTGGRDPADLPTPKGIRRKAPSSRVHSVACVSRPIVRRWPQGAEHWDRSRQTSGIGQPPALGCGLQEPNANEGDWGESLIRATISWSNSASDCCWAISRSSRLGSVNNGSLLSASAIGVSLRVFVRSRKENSVLNEIS